MGYAYKEGYDVTRRSSAANDSYRLPRISGTGRRLFGRLCICLPVLMVMARGQHGRESSGLVLLVEPRPYGKRADAASLCLSNVIPVVSVVLPDALHVDGYIYQTWSTFVPSGSAMPLSSGSLLSGICGLSLDACATKGKARMDRYVPSVIFFSPPNLRVAS